MKKVRVLIVEDSAVTRRLLVEIVKADARMEVVADVGSAEEALRGLAAWKPDVITMDLRLPGINGIQATRQIMSTSPTPIVVVTGASPDEREMTQEAMKAGVVHVITKPQGFTREDFSNMARTLCNQLVVMSQVRVIRQRSWKAAPGVELPRFFERGSGIWRREDIKYLAVVASTGGPAAVARILNGLGEDFTLPILLVQHISPSFVESFRRWLDGVCPLPVRLAKSNEIPEAGVVYLAPPEHHLALGARGLHIDGGPPLGLSCPSGNVLFSSLAKHAPRASIGVLLTGMGEDGALGLHEMQKAGCLTIAEDESTAVINGMPGTAQKMGAVIDLLPLPDIAPRILQITRPPE